MIMSSRILLSIKILNLKDWLKVLLNLDSHCLLLIPQHLADQPEVELVSLVFQVWVPLEQEVAKETKQLKN
jgi:hypothetical protein